MNGDTQEKKRREMGPDFEITEGCYHAVCGG
jgi:hypothetical protein